MLDTLYVANALPDTLKLAIHSGNNSNLVFQLFTLFVALSAIIIGPFVQLRIATMNKKSEKEKMDNDLYKEIDLVWLDKFEILISQYLSLLENLLKEIREIKLPVNSNQITNAYFFNRTKILLHMSRRSQNQIDLVNEIENDLKKLLEIDDTEGQIRYITKHIDVIIEISHYIINDVLGIKGK